MARTPWLVDSRGIAMKVKNATQFLDVQKNNWRSDASITCPYCNHQINNDDVTQEWPGLPAGVKFDPSDQELLEHLAAKGGIGNAKPHSFIDEFISTLEEDDGICYTHPEKLPGVKQDGSSIHFFHRTARAYTTGTRKRRKIHNGGDVRWHKTGKTRPVFENGIQKGCKKIMVLYMASLKGSKAEKTNWVMHQYHLGNEEEEKEGEFVVSKVFYQQLPTRQYDKNEPDASVPQEDDGPSISKEVPVTPKTTTPDPPRSGKRHVTPDLVKREHLHCMVSPGKVVEIDETNNQYLKNNEAECEILANANLGNSTWWAGESQLLDDSQQLMDDCLFCDEILENHSCQEKVGVGNCMPCLSECGRIGSDELGKELYQPDASAALENIDLDTPPEVQITDSQFSSQESLLGWLNKNTDWLINDKAPGKSSLNLGDTQCSI